MTNAETKSWVRYWAAAKMLDPAVITSEETAALAIKYTQALRVGVARNLAPSALFAAVQSEFPASF